jgi:hypothetical protein
MPALPFKLNQDRRHHIPRQQYRVLKWPAYEAGLRQRGNLTVRFNEEAITAWKVMLSGQAAPTQCDRHLQCIAGKGRIA